MKRKESPSESPSRSRTCSSEVISLNVKMPQSKPYMASTAFENSTATEHSQATPPVDVAPPKRGESHTDYFPGEKHTAGVAAGRLPEDIYANTLPWWRAALRRKFVAEVEWESEVIAKWQVRLFFPPSLRGPNDEEEEEPNIVVFVYL